MDLYVHTSGSPEKPAVVFLHGGGLSGRMWLPQMESLLKEYYCLAPDLPEQGKSAGITPFTLEGAVEQVAELIRTRAQGKAYIVGLSLGGAVALSLLRSYPELVDKMVISGTSTRLGPLLGGISKGSAVMYRWLSPEKLVKSSLKQFGIPAEFEDLFREDLKLGATEQFTIHFTDALMNLELPQTASSPLLVAVGEKETFVARRAARQLAEGIAGAQGVLVPGVGHVWNLQKPHLFTKMLRAWFTGSELPSDLQKLN